MCQMLLSINPEHIDKILSGAKQYEFRKVRCRLSVDKIFLYTTYPMMKVVAEAEIAEIIEDDLATVWDITKEYAGISYDYYSSYYAKKEKAIAYRLKNIVIYKEPKKLSDFGVKYAPQSFIYLNLTD